VDHHVHQDDENWHQGTNDGGDATWDIHLCPGDQAISHGDHEKSTDGLSQDMVCGGKGGFSDREQNTK
jgi:hypothetical protein